jgi:Tol biopolymer transport system component
LAGLADGPAVALSPDGSHLVYVAGQGGVQQLYLRAMDGLESRTIPGTEGATSPFFSPDGQWLGFSAAGKLKKISLSGGAPVNLADVDAQGAFGASWSSQGTIAFAPHRPTAGLRQVSDTGGNAQPLTRLEKGENLHVWPEFLPGGKAVLFSAGTGSAIRLTNGKVAVQSVGSGERRDVIQDGGSPRYASSGHLVYAQAGNLMAVPFDPQRLVVTGAAVPVVQGVLQHFGVADQYSVSATGSLVYVPGNIQSDQSKLVWVSRNGAEQPLAVPAHGYALPRLSPDGRRLAVGITEQDSQVWLYDLSRNTLTRFTFEGNTNQYPVWTPDGKRIAFSSNKEGSVNIFWQLADGSGGLERLTTSQNSQGPSSWSPDGQLLAFVDYKPTTSDIWVLRLSDRKVQPFLQTRFNEAAPRFSPDDRWLAYMSDESGGNEVYVQPYPGPGGKYQISTEGGTEPVWNPNGRELFYRNGNKMMAVDVITQGTFSAGKPRMLFEGQYQPIASSSRNYDVSPDGQRLLMLKPVEQAAATQIVVVQNFFEELKRRVPTGKK